ncbi:MAG TPA: hypothetical protein VF018_01980, partial [Acidobacteriaceae bacterium]
VWQEVIAKFPEMKRWVVHNKTIPVEILHLLSNDPAREVRFAIAMKNKLPPELMKLLARDSDAGVRLRIAFNKNAPQGVLEQLTDDTVEEISSKARERLASLRSTQERQCGTNHTLD